MTQRLGRLAPLSGLGFLVFMVATFVIAGDSPDSDAPRAKIVTYLADTSYYHRGFVAMITAIIAVLLLLTFAAVVRDRLTAARASRRTADLAFAGLVAGAALIVVAITLFVGAELAGHDALKHGDALDPSVYRLTNESGYVTLVGSAMLGSLVAGAVATAGLGRSAAFPRWFGWLSAVMGVAALASPAFFPMVAFWIWVAVLGIVMTVRPLRAAADVPAQAGELASPVPV